MKMYSVENRTPPKWLLALGKANLPASFRAAGDEYHLLRTFKHDFFAATALYEGASGRVVLKVGRTAPLFGIPLEWIGRLLSGHEARLYQLLQSVPGVPRFVGTCGPTGLIHEYVEGGPLSKEDALNDEFFPRLSAMLDAIHASKAAYVDLEKRENVLLGEDGRPHLIDFQISWHLPANRGGDIWPFRVIRSVLQDSDRYHLLKHWRRLRPDQLDAANAAASFRVPFWIKWHRAIFRPLTLLRRQVLVWLGARDSIRVRSPG